MNDDYYGILGVSPFASDQDIRSAYRRLAKVHHPDVNPADPSAEETFKQINEANQVLSNPESRRQYDRSRIQKTAPNYGDEAIHFAGIARKPQTLTEVGVETIAVGIKHGSAGLTILGVGEIFLDWWLKSK